jgi:hypothetical protein
MNTHRYTLEPYKGMKTRYNCPNCNKTGVFTKYIDLRNNEYVNDIVGCCNRIIKCSYHYKPKQYFKDNNYSIDISAKPFVTTTQKKFFKPITSFIDVKIMNRSLRCKTSNCFIDFLSNHWSYEVAIELADKYNIGTSSIWPGATVFWQVDNQDKVRSGKIMLYHIESGKRIKKPFNHINWVHKSLKLIDFNLEQCYFGEHLLKYYPNKPIAIVESEKTAVISSVYLPEFLWLACGSANNLNESKARVLKGRNVVLFPDLNCYDLWLSKSSKLKNLRSIRVSKLLKDKASIGERLLGLDIADYLLKLNIDSQPP